MRYCVDTWFILNAFSKEKKALEIIQNIKFGKDYMIISIIAFAESIKKLMQMGASQDIINEFFEGIESSKKVEIILVNKQIAIEAAKISLSYNLPLIDAFIAVTSKLTDCDALISGDEHYIPLVKSKYIKTQSW